MLLFLPAPCFFRCHQWILDKHFPSASPSTDKSCNRFIRNDSQTWRERNDQRISHTFRRRFLFVCVTHRRAKLLQKHKEEKHVFRVKKAKGVYHRKKSLTPEFRDLFTRWKSMKKERILFYRMLRMVCVDLIEGDLLRAVFLGYWAEWHARYPTSHAARLRWVVREAKTHWSLLPFKEPPASNDPTDMIAYFNYHLHRNYEAAPAFCSGTLEEAMNEAFHPESIADVRLALPFFWVSSLIDSSVVPCWSISITRKVNSFISSVRRSSVKRNWSSICWRITWSGLGMSLQRRTKSSKWAWVERTELFFYSSD